MQLSLPFHISASATHDPLLRRVGLVWLASSALTLGGDSISAQGTRTERETQIVEGEWTCRACIRLTPILTLGDTAINAVGPSSLESAHTLAVDGTGAFWIGQVSSYKVFASDGRFIGEVGREGQGPGEFGRWPGPTFSDNGGNIHIIDNENGRESVFTPDRILTREYRLFAHVREAVALSGSGRRLVNALAHNPAQVALPLHLLDQNSVVRSFGRGSGEEMLREFDLERKLAAGAQSRAYAAEIYDYRINVWHTNGRGLQRLEGPTLNSPPVEPGPWPVDRGPPSKIVGLHEDADGNLWVMRHEQSPTWRSHMDEVVTPRGIVGLRLKQDLNGVLDTRIDVLDPATGRILTTHMLSQALSGFVSPGLLWQMRLTKAGAPFVVIWRVER